VITILELLFYLRLVALSSGALVYLFLLALILGHRRPRNFERLLFFLILSLFLIYAGSLLELNAQIQYGSPTSAARFVYSGLLALALGFLPALLVQVPLRYYQEIQGANGVAWCTPLIWIFYLVPFANVFVLWLLLGRYGRITWEAVFTWVASGASIALMGGVGVCILVELLIARRSKDKVERRLFNFLWTASLLIFLVLAAREGLAILPALRGDQYRVVLELLGILPGALLIYFSLRHNFLDYGAQRNLIYGLCATILALLYLAFVRRISGWLEPYFPPEATAGFLLFVLIFLFEPLERVIGPALHRRIHAGMEGLQRLTAELQEQARQGSLTNLLAFAERQVREEFGLAAVRISMPEDPEQEALKSPGGLGHVARIPILKEGREVGSLEAATTGAFLTGETSAALEFLTEQLPGLTDLARVIEEKVRLERELAGRERLALLGQMAASVSHNLRNPLSSMKTILQVQLENPDLPFDARYDCGLVVGEIDRMSAKLTQLLKYSKPSVNGQRVGIVALARQTAALLGRDAERRNIRTEFDQPAEEILATGSEEAVSEILSNLLVNAIEAQPKGGRVRLSLRRRADRAEIEIEDDGPGIARDARARMFQPFFTTKAAGTGLGLSIVARRVADLGGKVECESPVRDGRGTKFRVTLPVSGEEGKVGDAEHPDRG
jgi:signal transduction histidine kinase